MRHEPDSANVEAAATTIRNLKIAIAEAESHVQESSKNLVHAQQMLKSLAVKNDAPGHEEYVKAARQAWKKSVNAEKLSLVAWQSDIDTYRSEVDDILQRFPQARLDN